MKADEREVLLHPRGAVSARADRKRLSPPPMFGRSSRLMTAALTGRHFRRNQSEERQTFPLRHPRSLLKHRQRVGRRARVCADGERLAPFVWS